MIIPKAASNCCRAHKSDIIVFSSASHGGLLQKMWAYESRAYFAGACARFPEILSPQGEPIAHSHNQTGCILPSISFHFWHCGDPQFETDG